MALASGTRLGPYEILSAIGAGGMGEVYRATDTTLGRQVAIKILPDAFASDPERMARFEREAKTLASLNHPNIAAIYGFEKSGGLHALVMELVEGEDLSQRLARGAMPIDEALPIAKQIADALEAAHEQGIIHRDLKPANIKVRADGTVKVLDFGLAKVLDPKPASSPNVTNSPTITTPAMTDVGMILGTAAYMSPEQAKGRVVDKRSDVWAFGCVLYEMLTAQRAFGGEDVADVLSRVLQREPDFGVLPPSVPVRVIQALRVCLRKDPKQRVGDVRDVRLVLEGAFDVAPPQMTAIARSSAARGHIVWTVAMTAILVAFIYLYLHKTASAFPPAQFELQTPPTSEPLSFALSPDGRQLTFVAMDGATSRLWMRPLDQLTARPLAGTEGASYPFWAPDARAIAFFADGKLKRLELGGGAAQDVADAPSGRGGTWNQDGVILFAPTTASALMRVPATGGTPAPATHFASGQKSHRWPQFLPDGHHFLFLSTQGEPGTQGVFVGALDNEATTRVVEDESAAIYAEPDTLLFVRRGSLVAMAFDPATGSVSGDPKTLVQPIGFDPSLEQGAVAVSRAGVLAHRTAIAGPRQLVWVDRTGTERGTLGPVDEQAMAAPELTRDGRRVTVFRTLDGKGDVWIIDVGRSVPSRFTSDGMFNAYPVWSPDGRQIAFTSMRQGTNELVERPTDTPGGNRSLLGHADVRVANDFSPDGRFLLFAVQVPQTGVDLRALPLIGGGAPFPVAQTPFDEMAGQFSPDGGEVAFQSNESGRMEVYAVSFPRPGPRVQLSSSGGSQPRWSADGRELFYVSADGRMMAVPIRAGSAGRLFDPEPPIALFPTHLATGANIPPAVGSRAQYDVAPDGRFLMNVSVENASAPPITVVLNWRTALEK